MRNKEYKNIYISKAKELPLPIQMQPYWLDTVCKGNWDVALSIDNNGEILGALPYYHTQKWGLETIKMPPLTDYIGPYISSPDPLAKRHTIYKQQKDILSDLILQLPNFAFYYQQFYPKDLYLLPFYWAGFRANPLFTYKFYAHEKIDYILDNAKGGVRTNLRKAERLVNVEKIDDVEVFININKHSFRIKGMSIPYESDMLKMLDRCLSSKGQRKIYIAKEKESQKVVAGLYVVNDTNTTYCLLSGTDKSDTSHSSIYKLYWDALNESLEKNLDFDFCGSMNKGIEHVYRAFGAKQSTYYLVYRSKNKFLEWVALWGNTLYGGYR